MRNLKKVVCLSLALVMLVGMMVVGAGAAKFQDVPEGSKKQPAVNVMSTLEVIKGDAGSKNFRPNDTLSRAEAAVIISKVLLTPSIVEKMASDNAGIQTKFADVAAYQGGWAAPYVEACVASQVIRGDDDTHYAPAREVSGVEFAAMLLRVLDLEKSEWKNWPFDWQRAALEAGLDANGADVFAEKLSRQDAAQMALNALQYSPEGEKTDFVVKDKDGKTLYSGTNETAAYLVLNDANKDIKDAEDKATITSSTTTVNSRGQKLFGLVVTKSTDELGRTAVNYKAPSYKLNLTVAEGADYVYENKVTNKAVYNDVGKDVATTYTWTVKIEGDVVKGEDGKPIDAKPGISTAAYQNTETGAYTEVYVKDDEKQVNVFISYYHIATVSKVVEPKNKGDVRYVMIDGKRYETEAFEAKDVVVYTLNGTDIDTVIPAPEYTAQLTKIVNETTFTLEGETYVCAKYHEKVTLDWGDLGEDITFYVDPMGNIMKRKGVEAGFNANYIWIVANSSAKENEDYVTSVAYPWSYGAYGIKADGTVEHWNIISVDGRRVHPTGKDNEDGILTYELADGTKVPYHVVANNDKDAAGNYIHYGMYQYKKVGNSYALTTVNNPADENIEVNKPYVTYTTAGSGFDDNGAAVPGTASAPKVGLANSKTTFVFFTVEAKGADHTIVENSVKVVTGIANIGTDIEVKDSKGNPTELETGVVADKNTVQVVFVMRPWSDGSTADEAGVAYLVEGSRKHVEWWEDGKKHETYQYTGIDADGNFVTLTSGKDVPNYGGKVWAYDENEWLLWTLEYEKRQWSARSVYYISKDAVMLEGVDHAFNITGSTTVVDLDGGYYELKDGDTVIMATEATKGAKHWDAQVVYVVRAATELTLPKVEKDMDKDGKTVVKYVVAPEPGTAFRVTGLDDEDDASEKISVSGVAPAGGKVGDVFTDWKAASGNVSDVMGFLFSVNKKADEGKYFTLTIRNGAGMEVLTETNGPCSGKFDTALFYEDLSGWAEGNYTWTVTVHATKNATAAGQYEAIVANGRFEIEEK